MNKEQAEKQLERLNKQLEHFHKTHRTGIVGEDEFLKGKKEIEKKIKKLNSDMEKNKVMKEMLEDSPRKAKKVTTPKPTKSKTKAKKLTKTAKPSKLTKNKKPIKVKPKKTKKPKADIPIVEDSTAYDGDFEDDKIPWTFVGAALIIFFLVLLYLKLFTGVPIDTTVRIVEYSDFSCEHCADVQETLKELESLYGSQLEFTFKYFPLTDKGYLAAQAAECAAFQGYFWEYHDLLYENWQELDKESLTNYADWLGLNLDDFNSCLILGSSKNAIEKDISDGQEIGVEGTPTFFIGDQMVVGAHSLDVFQGIIDQELK
jgi:predicted DsbA family dithiol-disulfide isomerase